MTSSKSGSNISLSPQEFVDAVLSRDPAVAVFDCDGTLWSGDSGYDFMIWSIEEGIVSRNASDWIDSRYRLYRAGKVSEVAMGKLTTDTPPSNWRASGSLPKWPIKITLLTPDIFFLKQQKLIYKLKIFFRNIKITFGMASSLSFSLLQ